MLQWFFRITKYAGELHDMLDEIDWAEVTVAAQRNWIGKSTGAELVFQLEGTDETLTVFTTRPDTVFGATYMVLAPEHPLVQQITTDACRTEVDAYVERSPITYAPNVKTPVLLLHGEADVRCPISQSEEYYTALKRLGKPVEFVRFPGGFHGFTRVGHPAIVRSYHQHVLEWFDRTLR